MLQFYSWQEWYRHLDKPAWTPQAPTITSIWMLLYPLIFLTFFAVIYEVYKKKLKKHVLMLFISNLIANFLFTPVFFGLKNLQLSAIDITVVWFTTALLIQELWPNHKSLAILLTPYLVWVTIATILQISITLSNL